MARNPLIHLQATVALAVLMAILTVLLLSYHAGGEETGSEADTSSWLALDESTGTAPETKILRCDTTGMELDFTIHGLELREEKADVAGEEENFQLLTIPENGHIYETGRPQLPVMRTLLIVPSEEVKLRVKDSKQQSFPGFNIYPAQPPTTDCSETPGFVIDNEFYQTEQFHPTKLAEIASTGTLRDYRIVQLQLNPVQFNPATGELEVYRHLTIELEFGESFVDDEKAGHDLTPAFGTIYEETLLNYPQAKDWTRPRGLEGGQDADNLRDTSNRADYLIISFDSFYDTMLPLVDAKAERGLEPMVVNTSDVYAEFPAGGNDESIQDFITYAFENWELPPLYVLLVGDVDQLPIHYSGDTPSDHYYSCVGDDDPYYPDVHLGRLSGGSAAEIELMRDRIIDYCADPPEGEWQTEVMLAAHGEGAPGKYQGCKEEIRNNIILQSPNADIWQVNCQYAAEGATTQGVVDDINEGTVIVNYRGHGGETDWSPSNNLHLTRTEVTALQNGDHLTVVYSLACLNNALDYDSGDCIGEAWLEAPEGGAIVHFGATRPSYTTQNHYHDKCLFNNTFYKQMNMVGEVITLADIQMLDYWGTGGAGSTNVMMYLQLGDPEVPVCAPVLLPHDLTVKNMVAPRHVLPGEEATVSAQVKNTGMNDESDIDIVFCVDGTELERRTIPLLGSGEFTTESFSWTTDSEAIYDLSICAEPVEDEDFVVNNQRNAFLNVFVPRGNILFDQAHLNNVLHDSYRQAIFENRYLDHLSFQPVTEELLDGYDVFVTVGATAPYTTEETTAIEAFVNDGGGLLVIGDDDSSIYNPLTGFAGISWTDIPGLGGSTSFVNSHNTTEGVATLYFDSPSLSLLPDQTQKIIAWDITHTTVQLAATEHGMGKVVVLVDDDCLHNDFIDQSDNGLFGGLVVDWINNELPVAVIDLPLDESHFLPSEETLFDASSSHDPDDDSISYSWTSDIDGHLSIEESFSRQLSKGRHEITLEVDDGHGKTGTVQHTVIVNTPPVAVMKHPVSGWSYETGEEVRFDATTSHDGDDDELSYLWTSDLDGELGTSGSFRKVLSHGLHTITLVVDDGIETDTRETSIAVNIPPLPGIRSPRDNEFFLPGETIEFDGSYSHDEDGDELSYIWTSSLDGIIGDTESFDAVLSHGRHQLTLQVNDGYRKIDELIEVTVNTPPEAVITSPRDGEGYLTSEWVSFDAAPSSDADGDTLSFLWWSSIDGELSVGGGFNKRLSAGEHEITLTVSDGYQTDEEMVEITVNTQPVAVITSPEDGALLLTTDDIMLDGSKSRDDDDDHLDVHWTSDRDGELGNARFFTTTLSAGEHVLTLEVDDGRGGVARDEVEITVNTPPTAGQRSLEDGKTYLTTEELVFDASPSFDPEDTLRFRWTSSIDGSLGNRETLSCQLSAGEHEIVLEVDDGRTGKDTLKLSIWVNTPPEAGIARPRNNDVYLTTDDVVLDASFSFDPEDEISCHWSSDIDGDIGYGMITTDQLTAGTHRITLTVDDGRGGVSSTVVTVEVDTPPEVILQEPNEGVTIDETTLILSWEGIDEDGDELSYDVYLDTVYPPQILMARELEEDFLELTELERGTTYYWKVVVSDGVTESESGEGSFSVKKEDESFELGDVTQPVVMAPTLLILGLAVGSVLLLKKRTAGDEEDGPWEECPSCGGSMEFVGESEDFYCWSCEEYLEYMAVGTAK